MKNQNKIHSFLEILVVILVGVIIGVGMYGCNKNMLKERDTLQSALGDELYKQTKIAFQSFRDGNFEIYIMNADGSDQTRLTNNPAFDQYPSLSRDGKKITFVSNRDGNSEIYVMNADGSEIRNLTNSPFGEGYSYWSPFLVSENRTKEKK